MARSLKQVIAIDEEKCVNCHQCVHVCPVKFCNDGSNETIHLNPDLCLGCGACIDACQHEARTPIDDFDAFLRAVKTDPNIVAIVAPAAASNFPDQYLHINGWLASLGVKAMFDVSFGAELTVKSYIEHIKKNNPACVIAQPCPALVTYIQIYHPELIPYLAPADSPMMHTMKMIREFYPQYQNHKFVIISPCLAKRREFDEVGIGEYNVTIKSIDAYFKKSHLQYDQFPKRDFDNPPAERAVLFSTPGGLMRTAERDVPGITSKTRKIEGTHTVYDYLKSLHAMITAGKAPLLVDCLSCEKGCNGGPGTLNRYAPFDEIESTIEARSETHQNQYKMTGFMAEKRAQIKLQSYISKHWKAGLYDREYEDLSNNLTLKKPSQYELDEIYKSTFKTKPEDFLHCSSCGYHDCEEMAFALYNGLTKPENCRHYQEYAAEREAQNVMNAKDALAKENDIRIGYIERLSEKLTELNTKSVSIKDSCDMSLAMTDSAVAGVSETATFMTQLKDSTVRIQGLIDAVRDIAERVHILGINASIEAAKQGDMGKGFEVVAAEIQELSQHTNNELDKIVQTLNDVVKHANDTTEQSRLNVRVMEEIHEVYTSIVNVVNDQNSVIHRIADDSNQFQRQSIVQ